MMVNFCYNNSQTLEHEVRHRIDYKLNKAFEEKEYGFILHILSQLELHEHKMECTNKPKEVMFNQEE